MGNYGENFNDDTTGKCKKTKNNKETLQMLKEKMLPDMHCTFKLSCEL